MSSKSNGGIINNPFSNIKRIYQITKTVVIKTNYISENISTNSPKSNSNFINTENSNQINHMEIKIDDNNHIINRNANKEKSYSKSNINRLIIISGEENNINEEIFLYYNKVNYEINKNFEEKQLLYFILSRLDKNKTLKCNILLNNNNYILYSNTNKFILSAKKSNTLFHKNLLIYTKREFANSSIIAQLHSYSHKKEFILYDNGINPSNIKIINDEYKNNLRRYLLQIKFLADTKFEHFLIYLPKDDYFSNNNYNIDKNLKDKLNNKKLNNIIILENSIPKFDFYLNKFVDNFNDRVKEKSKFNFKIMNESKRAIECGKVNDLNYTLDISYPFSPLEAFAIAISIFDKNK